jgi:hypothetical protein
MIDNIPSPPPTSGSLTPRQKGILAGGIAGIALVMAGVIWSVLALYRAPDQAEAVRDIVIILLAAESLIVGLAVIVLMVQLARLTALVQNEVRPILESTQETLGTLRGTTVFLSRNLIRPVIRFNSSVSAVRRAFDMLRFGRSG